MVARDNALSSLFDAREKLSDLIVAWAPDANATPEVRDAQTKQLNDLLLQRDRVNGAISEVIATAFKNIASQDLLQATNDLAAVTKQLAAFGQSIQKINEVLKIADAVVAAAGKVIAAV